MQCLGIIPDSDRRSTLGPGGTWALSYGREPVDRRHGKHTSPGGAMEVRRTKRNCIAVYVCPMGRVLQSAAHPGLVDFLLLFSTGLRPWLHAITPPGLEDGSVRRRRRRCLQQWFSNPPSDRPMPEMEQQQTVRPGCPGRTLHLIQHPTVFRQSTIATAGRSTR